MHRTYIFKGILRSHTDVGLTKITNLPNIPTRHHICWHKDHPIIQVEHGDMGHICSEWIMKYRLSAYIWATNCYFRLIWWLY